MPTLCVFTDSANYSRPALTGAPNVQHNEGRPLVVWLGGSIRPF
jgi:hypothetical protein